VERKKSYKQIIIYTILGILIGIVILVFNWGITVNLYSQSFSISGIIDVHKIAPIIYAYFLVPIISGIGTYFVFKKIIKHNEQLRIQMQTETEKSKKILEFTERLRNGEYNIEYQISGEDDQIGQSLINLRDDLKRGKNEEEMRRCEDSQRRWATEGFAKFGEILRENSNNMDSLSYNVISNLAKYMDAIQGAFYILYEERSERYFEQTATYAYERRKFSDRRIKWGEGLVGTCAFEKQSILITQVTESYVYITSGLGKSNPRCILLVPLLINDEVHGVIEFASFKVFEKFQVEFIEKLAESIASTIANFKINDRTAKLLSETQEQAKKMAQQEEIARRNMEELKETQREAAKQSEQFVSFTNSVNHTFIRAEYDPKGNLLYANTKFLEKLEYDSISEVEGKNVTSFIDRKNMRWFNEIWDSLALGGKHYSGDMKHITKNNNDLWTNAVYVCVRNQDGGVEKILFLGTDITENKRQSLEYEEQLAALNYSNIKITFQTDGTIKETNQKFVDSLGYTMSEIKTKSIFNFLHNDDLISFKAVWNEIILGTSYENRIRVLTKSDEIRWFRATFTPVKNIVGEIASVIFIAHDITEHRKIEAKLQEQTNVIKEQEEKLKHADSELTQRLEEAHQEIKQQYLKIEKIKNRHEKTFDNAVDAIVTINEKGIIEFFNKAAEKLWGYTQEEMIGKNIALLMPEKYKSEHSEYINNYLKTGTGKFIEQRNKLTILDKNKTEIPVTLSLSVAKLGNETAFTAFIQHDISSLKKTEPDEE